MVNPLGVTPQLPMLNLGTPQGGGPSTGTPQNLSTVLNTLQSVFGAMESILQNSANASPQGLSNSDPLGLGSSLGGGSPLASLGGNTSPLGSAAGLGGTSPLGSADGLGGTSPLGSAAGLDGTSPLGSAGLGGLGGGLGSAGIASPTSPTLNYAAYDPSVDPALASVLNETPYASMTNTLLNGVVPGTTFNAGDTPMSFVQDTINPTLQPLEQTYQQAWQTGMQGIKNPTLPAGTAAPGASGIPTAASGITPGVSGAPADPTATTDPPAPTDTTTAPTTTAAAPTATAATPTATAPAPTATAATPTATAPTGGQEVVPSTIPKYTSYDGLGPPPSDSSGDS